MAKGELNDPIYYALTDGVSSSSVYPIGPGDASSAWRVLVAGDSSSSVRVDNATLAVTKSGTWSIDNPVAQGDAATALRVIIAGNSDASVTANQTTAANLNAQVVGEIAHDAVDSGNPLKIGFKAYSTGSPPIRATNLDRVNAIADSSGQQFVRVDSINIGSYHENSSSQLTDIVVRSAPGAGLSIYITDIIVSIGAATAFNIFFDNGSFTILGPWYLEAVNGRGFAISFKSPKKNDANSPLRVTTSAAIAHSIDVMYFIESS